MGSFFSSNNKPQHKILVAGLDASGKTTMLYKIAKAEDIKDTIPNFGLVVETARLKNLEIIAWDSGGRMKIGPLKRHFFNDLAGVIYFVDANDRERVEESAEELGNELSYIQNNHNAPVLIFANKMDLPNAMSVGEIRDKFNQPFLKDRPWNIQPSCATSGDGLYEGLDWFTKEIERSAYRVTAACDVNDKYKIGLVRVDNNKM